MKRFKQLLKDLWENRLVNIYVIQELNNNDEVETEYYFKRERNRKLNNEKRI